ncbi:MAG TPA: pyridoxal-phosphate dependent enzyme [Flavisolibacter sp.]|jgi:1-aminocyclopropane-1-carboxylate deaminase
MPLIELGESRVQPLSSFYKFYTTLHVLRLDLIHPVISGNKWFKLKIYLEDALRLGRETLVTFGGAYSNHIVAAAAACKLYGLKSIGVIRGEKPALLSPTLLDAVSYGMELEFVSREDYRDRRMPEHIAARQDAYVVNEGGYGTKGAEGAASILAEAGGNYTHILAATGTGTMLAGLALAAGPGQEVTGIPVLKNFNSLVEEIDALLPQEKKGSFRLVDGFHFGGYAKYSAELTRFMNRWFELTGIPTDFVYTGKLFFALDQLMQQGYFPEGSRVLAIHSGGLQGNRSLPKGTLIF